jgi:hypothetical protein
MVSSLDFKSKRAWELYASAIACLIPAVFLGLVYLRWLCRRTSGKAGCCLRPVLFVVKEPRGPHKLVAWLLLAILLRATWLILNGMNVLGSEAQCLSGMNCASQVVVTLINRISQLLWFVVASRILPLLGFAAHAKAHAYEPGPLANPTKRALVEGLPVMGWDLSHLVLDWWLLVLQLTVLIVTLFVEIDYARAYPVYEAYQLQVVAMNILLAAMYALAALQHRGPLAAAARGLLRRVSCGTVCGWDGRGSAERGRVNSADMDMRAYFQYDSETDDTADGLTDSTGEGRRSLRMAPLGGGGKDGVNASAVGGNGRAADTGPGAAAAAKAPVAGAINSAPPAPATSGPAASPQLGAGSGGSSAGVDESFYAAFACWALLIAASLLVKAALFAYTPITSGGKISGVASEVVYPWLFYVLPEAGPPLLFLHMLLRGGLFSCAGWKCRPRRMCRRRRAANRPTESTSLLSASAAESGKPSLAVIAPRAAAARDGATGAVQLPAHPSSAPFALYGHDRKQPPAVSADGRTPAGVSAEKGAALGATAAAGAGMAAAVAVEDEEAGEDEPGCCGQLSAFVVDAFTCCFGAGASPEFL